MQHAAAASRLPASLTALSLVDILHIIAYADSASTDALTVAAPTVRRIFWLSFAAAFAVVCVVFGMVHRPAMASFLFSLLQRPMTACRQVSSLAATGESVKMVLVVRKDLKMGSGKIAAQCAHAAVAVVEELIELQRRKVDYPDTPLDPVSQSWLQWYDAWHASGSSKVAVQCPDEAAMLELAKHAKRVNLPYYVIRDAGRTQVAPGSKTVVAIGPGPKSLVDEVTGQLKLL